MTNIFRNSSFILTLSIASVYPNEVHVTDPTSPWEEKKPSLTVKTFMQGAEKRTKKVLGTATEIMTGSKAVKNYFERSDFQKNGFLGIQRTEFSDEHLTDLLSLPLSYQDRHTIYNYYDENSVEWGKSVGRFLGANITGITLGYGSAIISLGIALPLSIPLKMFGSSVGGMVGHVVGAEVGGIMGKVISRTAVSFHRKGISHKEKGKAMLNNKVEEFSYAFSQPVAFFSTRVGHYTEFLISQVLSPPLGSLGHFVGGKVFQILAFPFKEEEFASNKQAFKEYKKHNKFLRRQVILAKKGKALEFYDKSESSKQEKLV